MDQSDWDEKIDTVLMGYRASRQASTKQSPYYMLYQQEMRLPIDAELLIPDERKDGDNVDVEVIIDNLLKSREKTFSLAEGSINDAQKKQKKTYDRKHHPEEFTIGTEVLVENTADKQRKGGKLNPAWFGPYIISKPMGKGIYELSNKRGEVIRKKVNVNRLKLYIQRSDNTKEDPTKEDPEKTEDNRKKRKGKNISSHAPDPKKKCLGDNVDKLVKEILAGDELSDDHMTYANKLLHQKFPDLDGLQSPLLSQNDGFCPVKSDCDSVQIHHTGQFHWVTSALFNDTITLYDSKFNEKPLSSSLQIQLALIYKSRTEEDDNGEKTLFVEIPAVQQQSGASDCGLFAIAFAYHAGMSIANNCMY